MADFGMSRDTQEDGNQTKCEVGPLRYMAPEAMAKRLYSVQTDIWAFGVVMVRPLFRRFFVLFVLVEFDLIVLFNYDYYFKISILFFFFF